MAGHMGPRKFAREQLPRLKYWNPSIPMVVNRGPNTKNSAVLTIYVAKKEAGKEETGKKKKKNESIYPVHPIPAEASQRLKPTSWTKESPVPAPTSNEEIVRIGMWGKKSSLILEEFLGKTAAQVVTPTPGEQQEMETFAELERQAKKDSELGLEKMKKKREQESIMKRLAARVAESNRASSL
ncbi:hypothetical protein MKZ38_007681 [Zalerion maritima]|uniref:Ribosomal protein/NADH dehydrogenase domain-containing protein n=1 Tax=Zalerion maritima TaxID=339359 RepID=A0AAD5S0T1_9PEZI|nr:hypothetical protein MKZ38_007681 [Zalerion maritima]